MAEFPLLFDLGRQPPTTRTLALRIRDAGEDAALDQAIRRADAARYQEVTCRSALNPVKGMPFKWTLNPYRGCTHACHYCFARRYQTQFELGPGDHFSSVIFVKTNLPEVLIRELDKPGWTREEVAVGTATDPYQPIEGHYKLTRRALQAFIAARTPIGLVTKGPMVVRDADLLAELGERAGCTVCISVPTVDEGAWAALEPGTAHPLQRLRAVRELRKAGVRAGVLMAPIVPGFTTQPARLEATIRAIAEHDAAFVGSNVLHLKGGTKDHFLGFIATEFPQMLDGYQRMYPGAYAPPAYVATVRSLLKGLRSKYRVGENRYGDETDRDDEETNVVTDHSEAIQSESEDESCAASAGEQRSFVWAVRPSPRAR
jgi:DNA repair photolyase